MGVVCVVKTTNFLEKHECVQVPICVLGPNSPPKTSKFIFKPSQKNQHLAQKQTAKKCTTGFVCNAPGSKLHLGNPKDHEDSVDLKHLNPSFENAFWRSRKSGDGPRLFARAQGSLRVFICFWVAAFVSPKAPCRRDL